MGETGAWWRFGRIEDHVWERGDAGARHAQHSDSRDGAPDEKGGERVRSAAAAYFTDKRRIAAKADPLLDDFSFLFWVKKSTSLN